MKTILACKAQPIANQEPEPVTIIIDTELPNFEKLFSDLTQRYDSEWYKQVQIWYQTEAERIVEALYLALPQGTFDRLGIEFMKKKISLYRGITE